MCDNILKRLKNLMFDRRKWFLFCSSHGLCNWMRDEDYLKKKFQARLGYKLNLENPITFNEKIQWLKLHDRRQDYIKMVDKIEVKKYVSRIIGEKHIIENYGIYSDFDSIDFNSLPNRFVLKCSHDSGGIVICHDKYD